MDAVVHPRLQLKREGGRCARPEEGLLTEAARYDGIAEATERRAEQAAQQSD